MNQTKKKVGGMNQTKKRVIMKKKSLPKLWKWFKLTKAGMNM